MPTAGKAVRSPVQFAAVAHNCFIQQGAAAPQRHRDDTTPYHREQVNSLVSAFKPSFAPIAAGEVFYKQASRSHSAVSVVLIMTRFEAPASGISH